MNKILTILFIFLSFWGVAQHDTLITFGGYFVTTDGGASLVGIPSGGGGGLPVAGATFDLESDKGLLQASNYVYQWNDQTSNSLVFSQASGSYQPSYTASYTSNNMPALHFDNVNDNLSLTSPSSLGTMFGTWFQIYDIKEANGNGRDYLYFYNNTYQGFFGYYNAGTNIQWNNNGGLSYSQTIPFTARLETWELSNAVGTDTLYINSIKQTLISDPGQTFLGTCNSFTIGVSTSYGLGGNVMASIYYPKILGKTERNSVEYYLMNKYNLPLKLSTSAQTICSGSTASVSVYGATTYTWSNGSTGATLVVSPTVTTTYKVTSTAYNNGSNTAQTVVTVNTASITATTSSICIGSTTLTAGGGSTYTWNIGSTSSAITVAPTKSTTYTVTGTASNGCTNTANGIVVYMKPPTANMKMWLRADTAVLTSSNRVYQWSDCSPLGSNNAVQATGIYQPSYVTNYVNTRPALYFDQSNSNLAPPLNFGIDQSAYSFFIVVKSGVTGNQTYFGGVATQNAISFDRNSTYTGQAVYLNTTTQVSYNGTLAAGWDVMNLARTAPNNYYYSNNNSQTIANLATGTQTSFNQMYVGSPNSTYAFYIAEIIAYNLELSSSDRTSVYQYLKWKYGTN